MSCHFRLSLFTWNNSPPNGEIFVKLCIRVSLKCVDKIQVLLKTGQNNRHFTWRHSMYIYDDFGYQRYHGYLLPKWPMCYCGCYDYRCYYGSHDFLVCYYGAHCYIYFLDSMVIVLRRLQMFPWSLLFPATIVTTVTSVHWLLWLCKYATSVSLSRRFTLFHPKDARTSVTFVKTPNCFNSSLHHLHGYKFILRGFQIFMDQLYGTENVLLLRNRSDISMKYTRRLYLWTCYTHT